MYLSQLKVFLLTNKTSLGFLSRTLTLMLLVVISRLKTHFSVESKKTFFFLKYQIKKKTTYTSAIL